jgi:hypothetical protein
MRIIPRYLPCMSQKPCSAGKELKRLEALKRLDGDYKPPTERLTIHCKPFQSLSR